MTQHEIRLGNIGFIDQAQHRRGHGRKRLGDAGGLCRCVFPGGKKRPPSPGGFGHVKIAGNDQHAARRRKIAGIELLDMRKGNTFN